MARYFCHLHPDTLTLQTEAVDARPGRVLLAESPLYPGGGGQPTDQGVLRWSGGEVAVTGTESSGGRTWHVLADPAVEIRGPVEAAVDPAFRQLMRELHTDTHILNALIYQAFDGALVTGVQISGDGSARMDFDIAEADKDKLKALEAPINAVIQEGRAVTIEYVPQAEAEGTHGLIRSKSVAPPPTEDGLVRIVDIAGLDRQACGGTHLGNTANSRPLRILKIDNKGRHNRRIRIGLVGTPAVPK